MAVAMRRLQTLDGYDGNRSCRRRLSKDLVVVDERLMVWGKWARNDDYGVGWPALTILGRVIEQGADGATQQGRPPISIPEPIAEVDAAVGRLNSDRRAVVFVRYVHFPSLAAEHQRSKIRMSKYRWDRNLKGAREQVKAYFDEIELAI